MCVCVLLNDSEGFHKIQFTGGDENAAASGLR